MVIYKMDEATNAIREGVRLGETGISNKLYGDHLKREREMYNMYFVWNHVSSSASLNYQINIYTIYSEHDLQIEVFVYALVYL